MTGVVIPVVVRVKQTLTNDRNGDNHYLVQPLGLPTTYEFEYIGKSMSEVEINRLLTETFEVNSSTPLTLAQVTEIENHLSNPISRLMQTDLLTSFYQIKPLHVSTNVDLENPVMVKLRGYCGCVINPTM